MLDRVSNTVLSRTMADSPSSRCPPAPSAHEALGMHSGVTWRLCDLRQGTALSASQYSKSTYFLGPQMSL